MAASGTSRLGPGRVSSRLGAALAATLVMASLPGAVGAAQADRCERTADPTKSVARLWDEAILNAIRRDVPRPTVHARNLYHMSAGMWDAWAAYDPVADGVFVDTKVELEDPAAARDEAISYAAYRILSHRYAPAIGGEASLADFDALMRSLCYPIGRERTRGDTPFALGNRIAARIIRQGLRDGSRERQNYLAADYTPVNDPLIVILPGTVMNDPNRWQPLALEVSIAQNGLPLPVGPQVFVCPHWGHVTSFALSSDPNGVPIDPGPPPRLGDPDSDEAFKADMLQLIEFSSWLDPRDGHVVDISPGRIGGSSLGTNDGTGFSVNPATGEPYARNIMPRADFARVLAEFWADGPASETPPGHWNSMANSVTDTPGFERRIGGSGEILDALEWDVKLYLALNGAVHDAAIAAWGVKGYYDSVRPISMIRYTGGLGQSSDPDGPAYHPDGLPLVAGLVEVISAESAAPGERHAHLADHVGEIAIRSWLGNPEDPETELGGVDWIRAVEWLPYQKATFVTPAFAGYVSGHSTFSRAAAEVMTAITGSEFFPGGLSSWTVPAGGLDFELGPSEDVELQWATYYDAADQAGTSRIFGGIHPSADDFNGRRMGSQAGQGAWAKALEHFAGGPSD